MVLRKSAFIIIAVSLLFTQEVYEGFTLFTPQVGMGSNYSTTYLMDNDQDIVHSWSHERGPASMAYLMPDSTMYYPYRVENPTMESGGVGGGVQYLDWEGNVFWQHVISNTDYQHHHDIEPLPNGNVLMIAWEKKSASEGYAMGRQVIDNPLGQMWSEAIFEMQPDGNGGAEVVWEWYLWDHLIQNASSSYPNYGVVSEHPELFDINNGNVGTAGGPGGANADWMHFNAISYNENFDQIVLSSRFQDEIYIIDHSTTTEEAASHSGGSYGKGGDFLYRWGNPQNYDRGGGSDHILGDQHGINWIPDGYPGEGNFILFNNNHASNVSAVLEFIPPVDENGNYNLEGSQPYGPDSYIWVYDYNLDSDMQSGAFRLPNGNTLITEASAHHIREVTMEGNTVWSYTYPNNQSLIARAQKYPLDYFGSDSYTLGDINDDGAINVLDVVGLVNIILGNTPETPAGDLNQDGNFDVLDVVSLINIILGQQ